jgi:ATP-dependent DNA helicase PIF1
MCNGTRLQVTKLGEYVIEAKILAGSFTDNIVLIPRIPLTTNDDGSSPIKFTRLQFPIRPAFALTINKAQGQTLATTGLYLPLSVFAHGQLYVALSRCSDPNNLKVLILDKPAALRPTSAPDEQLRTPIGHHTRNIVYKEAL